MYPYRPGATRVRWVFLPIFLFLVFGLVVSGGRLGRERGKKGSLAFCVDEWRTESVYGALERRLHLRLGYAEGHVVVWVRCAARRETRDAAADC